MTNELPTTGPNGPNTKPPAETGTPPAEEKPKKRGRPAKSSTPGGESASPKKKSAKPKREKKIPEFTTYEVRPGEGKVSIEFPVAIVEQKHNLRIESLLVRGLTRKQLFGLNVLYMGLELENAKLDSTAKVNSQVNGIRKFLETIADAAKTELTPKK